MTTSMKVGLFQPQRSIIGRLFTALAAPLPFPPDPFDTRPLLLDLSEYNGKVNYESVAEFDRPAVEAVFIRAGGGIDKIDVMFSLNWLGFHGVKIPRSAYWFIRPDLDINAQGGAFLRTLGDDLGEGPLMIDCERIDGCSPKTISDGTHELVNFLETRTFKDVLVYSGCWFTNAYMEVQDWFREANWHLAHWLHHDKQKEHPGPPCRPTTVTTSQVWIHQTTDFLRGSLFGIQSAAVDGNRWEQSRAAFNTAFNIVESPQPGLEDRVKKLEAKVQEIETRLICAGQALQAKP